MTNLCIKVSRWVKRNHSGERLWPEHDWINTTAEIPKNLPSFYHRFHQLFSVRLKRPGQPFTLASLSESIFFRQMEVMAPCGYHSYGKSTQSFLSGAERALHQVRLLLWFLWFPRCKVVHTPPLFFSIATLMWTKRLFFSFPVCFTVNIYYSCMWISVWSNTTGQLTPVCLCIRARVCVCVSARETATSRTPTATSKETWLQVDWSLMLHPRHHARRFYFCSF